MADTKVQHNPIVGRTETLYDKLNNLASEISEGIVNINRERRREEIQREIDDLRDQSYRERSPEAVFNLLLFRKYADIANAKIDKQPEQPRGSELVSHACDRHHVERMSLIGELPDFVFEPESEELLVGTVALSSTIFRFRCVAAVFALIAFAVMCSIPNITNTYFRPKHVYNCPYLDLAGRFDFQPYQLVIAAGVLGLCHNLFYLFYYILPVRSTGGKYIPGTDTLIGRIIGDRAAGDQYTARIELFLNSYSKLNELLWDGMLFLLAGIAFIYALYMMNHPVKFTMDAEFVKIQYYTLNSFYTTFSQFVCIRKENDPTRLIQASLAMLFFFIIVDFICFLVSLRSFRQYVGRNGPSQFFSGLLRRFDSSTGSSNSGTAAVSTPSSSNLENGEHSSGVAFTSLPTASNSLSPSTNDDDDEEEEVKL